MHLSQRIGIDASQRALTTEIARASATSMMPAEIPRIRSVALSSVERVDRMQRAFAVPDDAHEPGDFIVARHDRSYVCLWPRRWATIERPPKQLAST